MCEIGFQFLFETSLFQNFNNKGEGTGFAGGYGPKEIKAFVLMEGGWYLCGLVTGVCMCVHVHPNFKKNTC